MTLTPRLGEVCGGRLCMKGSQPFLKAASLKPGEEVRSQVSLGRRVFHIIKTGLSQALCPLAWGKMSFLNDLTNFFFGILSHLVHFQVPERM